tara:strand:- start:29472 stop:30338 length:867 start_codon:yes stop_codon:yes gene_type:complete
MSSLQILGAVELGLIYGLVALGVYLTFRVIDFPDLTVDGSFPLGAAVLAAMLTTGSSPATATFCAFLAGCVAGLITGALHIKGKIFGLLAGILTMTGLYSVNLRIMGRPNIALMSEPTLFLEHINPLWILGVITILVLVLLICLLLSDFGLGMRAVGINSRVSLAYGINPDTMQFIALALGNGIVALAGALFTQHQGFADISMGAGTIIRGLAAVIIGEALIRHSTKVPLALLGCIGGSIVYHIAVAFALSGSDIGLKASDLNLITATLVAVTMILPRLKRRKGCVAS